MTTLRPLPEIPAHIHTILQRLHSASLVQEASITRDDYDSHSRDDLMRDKFIALDEDKSQYIYQLCRAINATQVIEAGTSFGVSTIYWALAVTANIKAGGGNGKGRVIATENEPTKAEKARQHWQECGEEVSGVIELREGDLLETLKEDVRDVDLLVLDIWTPMALPTLKLVQPHLRHGAIILADNTVKAAENYKEYLEYVWGPESGFITTTLPFNGGLEMSVYLPK
ncbi:hypothetical protein BGZ80_008593 [Entomortierella chlamydospora]|uniref:O-methyltransferase n=1 Tax=Entomortierella chlamydospora TaxID=101097 RepID=A0A9P6MX50_9FUNG|nr:hypothetical protein BGZ79_004868 [Entomortierella chlamydospora]KAG0017135.1 hypothetical protein BGZ80_008593 [Entomortierella chlamydospora]